MVNQEIMDLEKRHGWIKTPGKIVTREGIEIEVNYDSWVLPNVDKRDVVAIGKVKAYWLKWIVQKYLIERAVTVSTIACANDWRSISAKIISKQDDFKLSEFETGNNKDVMISLMESLLNEARKNNNLWSLYRVVQWYIWSAENYPEVGFCPAYGLELDVITIPGNPKGEAVRSEDPNIGPLNRSLELPLVIDALRSDDSQQFRHVQQRAAVALCLAFGRNPANYCYLKESDFTNITESDEVACYVLKIPRIKKRQKNPRDDFAEETLYKEFADIIVELIEANKFIKTVLTLENGEKIHVEKPLFIKQKKNSVSLDTKQYESTFNMLSSDITALVSDFAVRMNIVSPITGEVLRLTTRRFRYTLAVGLAAEGVSKAELARILDHTDTQHVHVYFEMAGNIVAHLDMAAAKELSAYLNLFKGELINKKSDDTAVIIDGKQVNFVNEIDPYDQEDVGLCGQERICHLDPPYSCYLCPKFRPYADADHEHVLDCLIESRNKKIEKYEAARLGVQLDHVISAVSEVVGLCSEGKVDV